MMQAKSGRRRLLAVWLSLAPLFAGMAGLVWSRTSRADPPPVARSADERFLEAVRAFADALIEHGRTGN